MIDNYNFKDKKVIIRVDFNVPLGAQYEVTDDTRIRGALPTIRKVLEEGGSAILMSHLGRPKSGPEEKFSLKHVIPVLSSHLGVEILFADNCVGEEAVSKSAALQPGQVLQAVLPQQAEIDSGCQGDQTLVGADIGCGLFPADVLFPGVEGEHIAALSPCIHGFSGQSSGHLADILVLCGE